MRFYLGTHVPSWLGRTEVPLFLSRGPLKRLVTFNRARGPWALDSGGFTEIEAHGRWTVSPADYAREVRLWQREIGNLDFSSPQDWMCEPPILLRSLLADGYVDGVRERHPGEEVLSYRKYLAKKAEEFPLALLRQRVCVHQNRTIENLISLREIAPEVPWIPVLQGLFAEDYIAHAEAYLRAGIDLRREPTVGLGSVCRRERLDDARKVISKLAGPGWGLRLHGFGLKIEAFKDPVVAGGLASADSLAWSFGASMKRRQGKKCTDGQHAGGCGNCIHWALEWRDGVLTTWEKTMLGKERGRGHRVGRHRIAANPDEWEDLPPMFAPGQTTPPPAPQREMPIAIRRPELPSWGGEYGDLPPTFASLPPAETVEDPAEFVVASESEGFRFPQYQAELLRKGIPIRLDVPPGLDARKEAENLLAAVNELSGSGDPTLAYLVQTGLIGDTFVLPDQQAAKYVHRAVLKMIADREKPQSLRSGALDLIKKIEAETGLHPQHGLHEVVLASGIPMLQLWRFTQGRVERDASGQITVCKPFAVDVRARRVALRLLADNSGTAWMKGVIDTFPVKFQEFYAEAWKRAHEEFGDTPENEDEEGWMRHGYALQEAWHGFAEVLAKAGAEVCVTDRTVCGCGDSSHNIIIYRQPGASGWYDLGIPYWIWEDPPMTGSVNTAFCRDFAEGRASITDDQWGFNAYESVTDDEWKEFCYGGEDDYYGTDSEGMNYVREDFEDGPEEDFEDEPEEEFAPAPEPVKPKKKSKKAK